MGVPIEKCYLFEVCAHTSNIYLFSLAQQIVANGISGIDVDKMDYFERDSHALGLSSRFDWRYSMTVHIILY